MTMFLDIAPISLAVQLLAIVQTALCLPVQHLQTRDA